MRHIIAIQLQNEAGALTRVAGLFSTRGYNIESLSVAATDDPTVSRITLVTRGSDAVVHQIAAQLNKLIDVVTVEDMTGGEHIERELVLLKLKVRPEQADAVRGYVVRAGGRVLDPANDGFIVELTASESDIDAFVVDLGKGAQLLEVVRSGSLGISRLAKEARSRREYSGRAATAPTPCGSRAARARCGGSSRPHRHARSGPVPRSPPIP